MKPEYIETLRAQYPLIFSLYGNKESRMPIGWGIAIDDGWYKLIDNLCQLIQHHIDSTNTQHENALKYNEMAVACRTGDFTAFDEWYKDPLAQYVITLRQQMANGTAELRDVPDQVNQVVANQIKEKFGGLRFYVGGTDDYVRGAIALAESMSYSICDQCGNKGRVGNQDIPMDSQEKVGGYYATRCPNHWGRLHQF